MVKGTRKEPLAAMISTEAHQLLSGLGTANGGLDEGPNPHEILEASLAACTILTAQLYANRKGLALASTDVIVKIMSEGPETRISREVSFNGDLTPEQKKRLGEIIERCPIHLLLESHVAVETSFR